ncbi:hypothetical protein DAEQUDRAFT_763605 [Daedalea quercina L-15889]|uniref:Uncharacterized protein n=1 Tax=Daedalea quercina L-15889 TaxID=1314783 RepID=A0A165SBD7_9APHY|nr:hypothetical protein DAEQUDRAFT_763605 [Daedalea quercina L-15889]
MSPSLVVHSTGFQSDSLPLVMLAGDAPAALLQEGDNVLMAEALRLLDETQGTIERQFHAELCPQYDELMRARQIITQCEASGVGLRPKHIEWVMKHRKRCLELKKTVTLFSSLERSRMTLKNRDVEPASDLSAEPPNFLYSSAGIVWPSSICFNGLGVASLVQFGGEDDMLVVPDEQSASLRIYNVSLDASYSASEDTLVNPYRQSYVSLEDMHLSNAEIDSIFLNNDTESAVNADLLVEVLVGAGALRPGVNY